MTKLPDETDLSIIEALREDGRTPNKAIAKHLDIAESTVAGRIRGLIDRRVMRVTLQRDIYSLGYQFQGFLDVYVAERSVDAVAADASGIDGVLAVAVYMGSPDLVVSFGARDREDLVRVIDRDIARIPGIRRVDSYLALEIRKYESAHGALGDADVAD
jgi:DNA-binding Lrp family transcriptional regulator